MALINCKEPNCTKQLNTKLACQNVTSLFGIRLFLETEQQKHTEDSPEYNEIDNHLNFVKEQLKEFKIAEEEQKFTAFSLAKNATNANPVNNVRELYLTCTAGHSYYYNVDCSQ